MQIICTLLFKPTVSHLTRGAWSSITVFTVGASDESTPYCPPSQGCSDHRAPLHILQRRQKGKVEGFISWSLANDNDKIDPLSLGWLLPICIRYT